MHCQYTITRNHTYMKEMYQSINKNMENVARYTIHSLPDFLFWFLNFIYQFTFWTFYVSFLNFDHKLRLLHLFCNFDLVHLRCFRLWVKNFNFLYFTFFLFVFLILQFAVCILQFAIWMCISYLAFCPYTISTFFNFSPLHFFSLHCELFSLDFVAKQI